MNRFLMLVSILLISVLCLPVAVAQLSGTKTIGGTSPDYATIKAAFQDLSAQGVTTPGVTFLIRGGTYNEDTLSIRTSTTSAAAPITIKPDAGATVVINVTPPTTGTPFGIKVDSTAYVTLDGSNNGTTSRDMSITAGSSNLQRGIWVDAQSHHATIKNLNVRTGGITSSYYGIYLFGQTTGNPDNSLVENNLVTNAYYGIRAQGTSTTSVNNVIVRNNRVDSVAFYGVYLIYAAYTDLSNNEITLAGGSSTVYAIYLTTNTFHIRVTNNKIHDLTTTSTSAGMYGITSFGTATFAQNTYFNNFIWGFNPPDAGTNAIYAIYISTANTTIPDTVAFNTVNLTGTSTGNKTTYAFYRASATGPSLLYNNILKNDRTDGTTGVAVAVYKTTAVTVLMSDFNDLYVGTPDARHVTGRITTTNNYITLADWRAANSSDASSVAENPPFVSATDLHIQTTVPTQLESGATPIAGIATDIDGTPRNVTAPDIGGDEFAGIGLDLSPPIISYVPLGPTSATTPRPLTTTITDALSGVPRAGIGLPVLYWRVNSGTYTGATATWTSGSQYLFTFGGGVVLGDTVSYYIAAQDSAGTPNVGVSPALGAAGLTANPPAAATPPTTPQSYRIVGLPLATGDYTIGLTGFARIAGKQLTTQTFTRRVIKEVPVGPEIDYKALEAAPTASLLTPFRQTELREVEETYSMLMEKGRPYEGPTKVMLTDTQRRELGYSDEVLATYPTITAAITDLNLRGVAGSVRFLLNDTSYATESFPIVINVIADSVPTASKTVTIKPNVGVTTRISGALASGALLRVLKTDYVTIDGSNATGGTTRDLTLQNTSTTTPQVLVFGSLGTTPITNGTLKNAIVINGINSSTPIIISDGTTAGNPGYFSNITIQNNVIRNAYHALYCNAVVAALNGANLLVNSNTVGSTATDSVRYDGVYIQGADGAIVTGNDIGGFSSVTSEVDRGVWLATGTTNTLVERNTVHDMHYGGTSGYGGKGIVVSSGLANCNNAIQNNMIYNLTGDGDSYTSFGATYAPNGIYVFGTGQGGVKIYYNTIYLYGNSINNDAQCYSIGIALDDGSAASVVDNLIINNLGLRTNVGVGPVAIAAEVSNAQFTAINYNNYYCNADSPAVDNLGKIAAVDYPTLSGWAAASGGDVNSISSTVNFVSPTNLHIVSTTPSPVDSAATPVAGITNDFDGNTRNATRPDIGADEFNLITLPPPVVSAVARSTRVPMQGDSVVVTCTITDTLGISTANLIYNINGTPNLVAMVRTGGTPTNGTYRGVVPGSANANGNRVELQIQANSTSGNSTTTAISTNNSYFAGISPLSLSGVKTVGPNRILLYDNYYARVTGTVNGPNYQTTSISYFFQDAVGGMDLFRFGTTTPALALGDSIIVLGRLDQFNGLTEITPDTVSVDIVIVATGRPVTAIPLTMIAFNANPELYESRLISMTGLQRRDATPPWPPLGGSANIVVYQGVVTDTTVMRIDSDTEIDGSPEPTYPVNVTGIAGQFSTPGVFDNGYQLQPRYLTDFTSGGTHDIGVLSLGAGPSPDGPSVMGVSREMAEAMQKRGELESGDALSIDVVENDKVGIESASNDGSTVGDHTIGGGSIIITPLLGEATDLPGGDAPLNFRALVRNYGTFIEPTYQVGWTIDGVAQTVVNQPRPLQVGATDTVMLTWASPTAGAHIARAFTILASDANHSNDTSAPYNFNVLPEGIVFQEGFNGTIPPYPTGWHVKNRDLGGTSTYFQGNPTVFTAFEGASYIGANYQAANGLYIDEWLVTPNTGGLLANPNALVDSLIFWQRSPSNQSPYYPDSIQIRVSTTDTAVASFTTVLDYFRVDTIGWRRKAYALPSGANRYIAFRYLHYNGGSGPNSNYIGLDAVQISRTFVPTPGWSVQTSGITNQFYSVKAVNATTAWAAAVGGRVLRTVDGGNTWTSVGGGRIGAFDIYNIAAVDANTAFVTTTPSTTTYIFRTTNGGAVWDTVFQQAGGFIDAIHMYDATNGIALGDPVPATLWVVLKTTNGGASWSRIATEPAAVGGEAGTQNDLAVSGPNNIWFGSSAGGRVYRSTNAGATWSSSVVPGGATATRVISVWFNGPNYGIAGHYTTSGVYNAARTTDGGATWSAITVGTGTTYNIAVGGSGNDDFWMARGTDVFRSTNRGTTWTSSYTGTGTFYDVDFYTLGTNTHGWGVKDNGNIVAYYGAITGVEEQILEIPQTFALMQNYPNPFNPTTTLRYGLPKDARVNLSIYNILGQRVATLKDEIQNVGYYDVVWDGRNDFGSQIASGVYFYRIEAKPVDGGEAFTSIRKMLMLK
jgi:hypothetical protein